MSVCVCVRMRSLHECLFSIFVITNVAVIAHSLYLLLVLSAGSISVLNI